MKKLVCILLSAVLLATLLAGCGVPEKLPVVGGIVGGKELESIACYPAELNMRIGDTSEITTVLTPADAKDTELIWSSSNPSVVSVSNGTILALGPGSCTVTAASAVYANVKCEIPVTVEEEETDAPAVPAGATLPAGTTVVYVMPTVSSEEVYPSYYLTESEVAGMDIDEIQFTINQIYAKNGYIFSTDSIQSYFSQMSWYYPVTSDSGALHMSAMDQANLKLLSRYRDSQRSAGYSASTSVGSLWTYNAVQSPLSESFVASLTSYDVQLLINTIYAKNGYIFSTPSLATLFEGQPWYWGWTTDASELAFSDMDWSNLKLLEKYQ